jgi:hypothetical protein
MVVSRNYAMAHQLDIKTDDSHREWLEFADGSVRRADGIVLNAEWSFGSRKYRDNFFVLDGIDADIVLSNDFLFQNQIISTHRLFGSWDLGDQADGYDSPRLNLIRKRWFHRSSAPLPQQPAPSHSGMRSILFGPKTYIDRLSIDDDTLAWIDEQEQWRQGYAEDLIHKLSEDDRDAAWAEEYRKRAAWEQQQAALMASVQTSIPQNPTQNPQPSTKARRRFRLIFSGKGRQKP